MQFKIRRSVATKVLAALRSGDYEQGMGLLCRIEDDGTRKWCCLGVMMDLAAQEGIVEAKRDHDGAPRLTFTSFDETSTPISTEEAYLSAVVAAWLTGTTYEIATNPAASYLPLNLRHLEPGDISSVDNYHNPRVPWDARLIPYGFADITKYGFDDAQRELALSNLNDNGVPFSLIADLIEEHLVADEETDAQWAQDNPLSE